MFELASRLNGVQESATLKMNALAKDLASKGMKVYNLTAGEPDFNVPSIIQSAAIDAIQKNQSRYTAVQGMPELRKAISEKLKKENNLDYTSDQILVSVGAKQAIFNLFLATLNSDDEVLIPSPYWVSYPEMVKIAGATPCIIETVASTNYKITPAQLKKQINSKTKLLILNSPSNPAGVTYSRDEFTALAHVLEGSQVGVCSDEIYEKIIFDGKFCSFASVSKDAFDRTITVNGFSKAFAMTGWRLGYVAGPKKVISAMTLLQGQSTSGASSIVQCAAVEAFKLSDETFLPIIKTFKARRDRLVEIFSQSKEFSFIHPEGAFYFLLNVERLLGKRYTVSGEGTVEKVIQDSEDAAFFFLDQAQVVCVAGKSFGCDNFLRLSFAVADKDLFEAAQRMVSVLQKLS